MIVRQWSAWWLVQVAGALVAGAVVGLVVVRAGGELIRDAWREWRADRRRRRRLYQLAQRPDYLRLREREAYED